MSSYDVQPYFNAEMMTDNSPQLASLSDMVGRGIALFQGGDFVQAKLMFDAVLVLVPRHFDALHLSGIIAAQSGDYARAHQSFLIALGVNPYSAQAHANCGVALYELGQFSEALAHYDAAIRIKPDFAQAHSNRGNALKQLQKVTEAIASYNQAIALQPQNAAIFYNRGVALHEAGQLFAAIESYCHALVLEPHNAQTHFNLGDAYHACMQLELALSSYNKAIALVPSYADAHNNQGLVLRDLGHLEEAVISFSKAIAQDSLHADAHLNMGSTLLLNGDFQRGWELYEWRWKTKGTNQIIPNFDKNMWMGSPALENKTILIHGEQGLGDALQFCRYLTQLKNRGARVLLAVHHSLLALFETLDGVDAFIHKGEALPPFDFHCPLLSLPMALQTDMDSIPKSPAYLRADSGKVGQWAERLGPKTKPRIGVVWSSTSKFKGDAQRSMTFAQFQQALPPSDFQYICLQKEIKESDFPSFSERQDVAFFGDQLHDFSDTAALVENLDLIISTCTSVPHLSGAMGKPTWVLLGHVPDWRWMLHRDDSPWYPSVKLYRQDASWHWGAVVDRVRQDLDTRFGM
jgi:tetratricopeptide (TPR) repeat protein